MGRNRFRTATIYRRYHNNLPADNQFNIMQTLPVTFAQIPKQYPLEWLINTGVFGHSTSPLASHLIPPFSTMKNLVRLLLGTVLLTACSKQHDPQASQPATTATATTDASTTVTTEAALRTAIANAKGGDVITVSGTSGSPARCSA
jgi:hypothetical protein